MLINRFLRLHKFAEHPFTKVAAEKEELLSQYFIEPRYFSEALGNARQPKSYVIFGPRGGGKSAIRSMIEHYCESPKYIEDIGGKVLCITYDDFSALNLRQLNTISLSDHINEILKRGVPKLAVSLVEQGIIGENLQEEHRGILRWFIDEYMSDLSKLELDSILQMFRSQSEKIKEILSGAVNLYNTVISALNLEKIEPANPLDTPAKKRDVISSIHVMEVFSRLASIAGFEAVYVLVDKIDETDTTGGDSRKAAKLVSTMLTNIKLLELERCAFKFFLWDNVKGHFGQELRADRITMKHTEWSDLELEKMLGLRVRAYSLTRTLLLDIFQSTIRSGIVKILISLSYKSPRDVNRLMEAIFAEATPEATDEDFLVTWDAVIAGIHRFSIARLEDLYPLEVRERVIKIGKTKFTNSDVAATFKITGSHENDESEDRSINNKARNVIEKWKAFGIIQQLDPVTVEVKGRKRSVSQYQITDPRIEYLINPHEFLAI
jgi:hypothetical protein